MLLDSAAAKALAVIVLTSLEGPSAVQPQLPLQIEDRGELWLVKGKPHTDLSLQLRFAQFHVFFRKTDAEILGFGENGRLIVDAEYAKYLRTLMTQEQFARLSLPVQTFEPWTDADPTKTAYLAMLGGLINKSEAAVDYAHVLMQTIGSKYRDISKRSLRAEERDGVWHVMVMQAQGFAPNGEVLSFSRTTGKLLSGAL